jgi:hypothetical protein
MIALYIHRVWTIADGGQLTGAAASRNILTLTLQVNFRIYKGDTITITGPITLIDPNIGEGTFEEKLDRSEDSGWNNHSIFLLDLCDEKDKKLGKGYWCPGSSTTCPCQGDPARRLIMKISRFALNTCNCNYYCIITICSMSS